VFDVEEWNNMLNLKGLEYNVEPIDEPGDQLPPFFDEFVNATNPLTNPRVPEGDTEDKTKTKTISTSDEDEEGTSKLPVAPNPSPTWYKANPQDVHRSTRQHEKMRELRHDDLEDDLERTQSRTRMHLNVHEDDLVSILLLKKLRVGVPKRPRGQPQKHPLPPVNEGAPRQPRGRPQKQPRS
jgi:hypothetical protein